MIRYWEQTNAWVSGKNPDEQGMPSTDLTDDQDVCSCIDCTKAALRALGTNYDEVRTILLTT